MSHTPDIDSEEELYHYMFLVDVDRTQVDSMHDVSAAFRNFPARIAAAKLTQRSDPFLRDISHRFSVMGMRMRYNVRLTGVYKVTTNFPLAPDELDAYLQSLAPEELQAFLKEAECKEHD